MRAGCIENTDGSLRLSLKQKKKILLDNIYGVDLDAQAVEVAQLSLFLKLLEDETTASAKGFQLEFRETMLPSLDKNVIHGNSLIGWDIGGGLFGDEEERKLFPMDFEQAFPAVMRRGGFDAIVGNPPYNAFAGTSPAEEQGLVEPYKQGLQDRWGVRKFNLDDLYIRFFRVAERRVAERTGQGIVCFISNYSWLSYGSFVVMRERLLSEFDSIWIDNLNGDSRETGKLTPDGDPDPSVFSTPMNREGIRVGTCITTLVRRAR